MIIYLNALKQYEQTQNRELGKWLDHYDLWSNNLDAVRAQKDSAYRQTCRDQVAMAKRHLVRLTSPADTQRG